MRSSGIWIALTVVCLGTDLARSQPDEIPEPVRARTSASPVSLTFHRIGSTRVDRTATVKPSMRDRDVMAHDAWKQVDVDDGIDLRVYRTEADVDQSNLVSDGNNIVSNIIPNPQQVGQTFTVSATGSLTGIEIAPLRDTAQGSDSLFLDVLRFDQLLGTASITAAGFPPGGGGIPAPLAPDVRGPGFFDLSALNIQVGEGEELEFTLRTSFPAGVCVTQLCTAGAVGRHCSSNLDCNQKVRVGRSNDEYPGGCKVVNGMNQLTSDLAFKTFVTPNESLLLDWSGGQPTYTVFRSNNPMNVTGPGNAIALTNATQWLEAPPAGSVYFYVVKGGGMP